MRIAVCATAIEECVRCKTERVQTVCYHLLVMEHRCYLLVLFVCLTWNLVQCITVTSRGEPKATIAPVAATIRESSSPPTISSRNFTEAVRLLERMLVAQERQRRLIPYYTYYVTNNNHNEYPSAPGAYPSAPAAYPTAPAAVHYRTHPTTFPVQNTALDLLARSIFAPYTFQQPQYAPQPQYRPKPTYNFLQLLATQQPQKVPASHLYDFPKSYSVFYNNKQPTSSPLTFNVPTIQPPSLPKLLSPLASVTRFPGPAVQKTGKNAPGRAGVDYPTYHTIPPTSFSCRTQRYKGFFADPETSCQVWHYCDFNGGQASFLCPNGTIFSQVLLTCDWWFNVKCTNTLQAYVLNERLYKYITPKKPSFPEDFTGLQVDDYLTQKQPELREKEVAKQERLKKKYKEFEFDDVDELQALLDKMRSAGNVRDSEEQEIKDDART